LDERRECAFSDARQCVTGGTEESFVPREVDQSGDILVIYCANRPENRAGFPLGVPVVRTPQDPPDLGKRWSCLFTNVAEDKTCAEFRGYRIGNMGRPFKERDRGPVDGRPGPLQGPDECGDQIGAHRRARKSLQRVPITGPYQSTRCIGIPFLSAEVRPEACVSCRCVHRRRVLRASRGQKSTEKDPRQSLAGAADHETHPTPRAPEPSFSLAGLHVGGAGQVDGQQSLSRHSARLVWVGRAAAREAQASAHFVPTPYLAHDARLQFEAEQIDTAQKSRRFHGGMRPRGQARGKFGLPTARIYLT